MLQGVDISHWNGKIDWTKMQAKKQAGLLDFVIIRAGSIDNNTGVCYTDYQFGNNVAGANAAGIPWAFYWFFRPNHDAKKQADYFCSLVDNKYCLDIEYDLWCDIEVDGGADRVLEFCRRCADHAYTGIYTNPNTIMYKLTGDKRPLAAFPLWLADWTPPANVPAPWKEYLIWQYAVKQDGREYGCESAGLDHNQALDSFLATPPAPPPSDLEARVTALEAGHLSILNIFNIWKDQMRASLDAYETRIHALEARPTATISAPFRVDGRTPARCIVRHNESGKPIFEIYPRDSSEVKDRIFLEGTVQVFPYAMTGDGARKAFPVYKAGAPQQLYVFVEDGKLV